MSPALSSAAPVDPNVAGKRRVHTSVPTQPTRPKEAKRSGGAARLGPGDGAVAYAALALAAIAAAARMISLASVLLHYIQDEGAPPPQQTRVRGSFSGRGCVGV